MIDCLRDKAGSAVLFNCEYRGLGVLSTGALYLEPTSLGQYTVYDPDDPKVTFDIKAPDELDECKTFLTGVNYLLEVIEEEDKETHE